MNIETIIAGISIGFAIVNGLASVRLYLGQVKNGRNVFCLMRANESGEIEMNDPLVIR